MHRYIAQVNQLDWPIKFTAFFISFFAPLSSLIHVIIILLVVDAMTSLYYQMKLAAIKHPRKEGKYLAALQIIESAKLRKTLEKMFFYVLMISLFYMFDRYVLHIVPLTDFEIYTFSVTNIAALLVTLVELTSISSNISKITGNPIFDRIVNIFSKKIDKQLDIEKDENEQQRN